MDSSGMGWPVAWMSTFSARKPMKGAAINCTPMEKTLANSASSRTQTSRMAASTRKCRAPLRKLNEPVSAQSAVAAAIQPAIQLPLSQYRPPKTRILKIRGMIT